MLLLLVMGNSLFSAIAPKMIMRSPVVVILGSTGTGKSTLAIELAKKFNGEIISADSMQVYKGLDIITNKVSTEEQQQAVHHFINCTEPLNRYTVVDFQDKALPLIENLLKQKKLPIIVGGTNYYIEALLWDVLIKLERPIDDTLLYDGDKCYEKVDPLKWEDKKFPEQELLKQKICQFSLEHIPSVALHGMLKKIDPVMANALHPEDRRKVIRSLQVYQQHGCKHSDLLANQRSQRGGCSLGGPLRYKNAVMLWLQCDKEALEKRLDKRLEQMLQMGLIEELLTFHRFYNENRINSCLKPSYSEGIFQSIGFKEFHNFLILSDEERNTLKGEKALKQAVEDMRLVTKRYARKQVKWITNRFLKKPNRQVPPVYGLNATDVDLWQENVVEPAIQIVQSVMKSENPRIQSLPIEEELSDDQCSYFCDVCERVFVGKRTWEIHIRSRKHSKRKASIKKELQEQMCNTNNSFE